MLQKGISKKKRIKCASRLKMWTLKENSKRQEFSQVVADGSRSS